MLAEIGEYRERLKLHIRAHPKWTGQLRRELFAAAIQGSNTIERITVSMADARAAVEGVTMSADVSEDDAVRAPMIEPYREVGTRAVRGRPARRR